jgi:hypothetical protein
MRKLLFLFSLKLPLSYATTLNVNEEVTLIGFDVIAYLPRTHAVNVKSDIAK